MNDSEARAIGVLESKMDLMLADQERAARSGKHTYEKLEVMDRKIDSTDVKIDAIDKRLKAVEEPGLVVAFGKKAWAAMFGS